MDPYENPESHSNKTLWIIGGIILLVMIIALIYGLTQKTLLKVDDDASSVTPTLHTPTRTNTKDPFSGKETVVTPVTTHTLEVVNLETNPPQVQAHITYDLSGDCSILDTPVATLVDKKFSLDLTARALKDAPCTKNLVPGEVVVDLDVQKLSPGTYTVTAGKQKTTFTLQALEHLAPTADK